MSEKKQLNEEETSKITPDIFKPTVATSSETRGGVITTRISDGNIKTRDMTFTKENKPQGK